MFCHRTVAILPKQFILDFNQTLPFLLDICNHLSKSNFFVNFVMCTARKRGNLGIVWVGDLLQDDLEKVRG